ncbi:SCO family protein [Pseudomonas sp. JS3066]|jgi:protein SCO1/2|uniref:SCO family protein n=1 Tax=unclassified Pseudomonas TaxID=196821 RepID=UPI000EA96C6F|nr:MULTISPECIES: SCO family protein [unclassified Pseudomonas]AYF87672.1 SCO family protein [Pseudomonas sp. DY-1]MDH4655448.1 SCO family protein [Pseudomonas sp. BN606]MRK20049.1 SCO family protein [Pseudomonas sp. JG-B]WVK94768.1 SCO family protein [Pseudomonas sp. JS3066]
MNTRRNLLVSAGLLGVVGVGTALGLSVSSGGRTDRPNRTASQLPNVLLTNQYGKSVRFYDDLIRGKVVAINMMYTSCAGICPTATANLLQVQRLLGARLGRQVHLYSITLAPELDTPQTLREYAARHGVGPGWWFLTGAPADIERVRFSLGFYDPEPEVDRDKNSHSGMLRIGNDRIERWTMAPALGSPEQILGTIDHVDPEFSYRHQALQSPGSRFFT